MSPEIDHDEVAKLRGALSLTREGGLTSGELVALEAIHTLLRDMFYLHTRRGRPRRLCAVLNDLQLMQEMEERTKKHTAEAAYLHLSKKGPFAGRSPRSLKKRYTYLVRRGGIRLAWELAYLEIAIGENMSP